MDPTFGTRLEGSWAVVEAHGELDLSCSEALGDAIDTAAGLAEPPRLAVDLGDVSFMDSTTLGILVAALKRMQERGGDLRLLGVHGSPAKVMAITGLDSTFQMGATVADLPA